MLILDRRPDQWIGLEIGEEEALEILAECGKIRIDVLLAHIKGDKAKIGFAADKRVVIHRHEVWEEIGLQLAGQSQEKNEIVPG